MLRIVLAAALLATPLLVTPAASTAEGTMLIPVIMGGVIDVAVLAPYDPRAPELAASAPNLADGLWSGHLARSGGLVRLATWDGQSVALVDLGAGLSWATLADGRLVPLAPAPEVAEVDSELRAPAMDMAAAVSASPAAVPSPKDGKLQILLDADRTFTVAWNGVPDGAARGQLAIVSLVDAIYRTSLGVEIEVVEQQVRTTTGSFTGPILCTGASNDLLAQFRSEWESTRPTTSDLRESALIFTSKPPAPHPSGSGTLIGCGYIGELETSWAYASARLPVPSNFPLQMTQDVPLVAHELGHNFGGLHHRAIPTPGGDADVVTCTGATVMYPFLCRNTPAFSGARGTDGLAGELLALDGGNAPWMEGLARSRI